MSNKHHPLILNSQQNVPQWVQVGDRILTVMLWLGYLYLIREAFFFLLPAFNQFIMGAETTNLTHFYSALHTIGFYMLIVFLNSSIFLAWAYYNWLRFHGKHRQKLSLSDTRASRAEFFEVSHTDLTNWETARMLMIHHDDNGKLVGIKVK